MRKIFLFLGLFLFFCGIGWYFLSYKGLSFLNPLSGKKTFRQAQSELKTVGFLPTWMVGKTRFYGSELDELIFLGIEVDINGNLIWDIQSKKINNEEFLKQKENITKTGGKNILGIKLFDDEKLDSLLKNSQAVENLVEQIEEVVEKNGFDGINIDFEYQNDPTAILDQKFFDFLDKLKKNEVGSVGMDIFVNTINKGGQEDLENLLEKVDELVIMAYDFHRPGTDFAGAVAPIDAEMGERSILELVKNITNDGLDKSKIILAYPLYGYEWKTYGEEFGAQIKRGWYQMVSWQRVKDLIEDRNLEVKWDEISVTPWLMFEENKEIHQIYFENEESLEIKAKLTKDNQFLGVGFWALGYEGDDNVLLVDD